MTSPVTGTEVENGSQATAYGLLQALLPEVPRSSSRLERLLPTSGTLHALTDPWISGRSHLAELFSGLRSVGQVILINNPLSGALLLLALMLQSGRMAAFAVLGIAGAQAMAMAMSWDPASRRQGIVGFNGALVGCAAATLAHPAGSALAIWLVLVPLAGALSAVLLEGLRSWWFGRTALPPLSLPACLIGWLLPLVLAGLRGAGLDSDPLTPSLALSAAGGISSMPWLLQAVVRAFGQVFLCTGISSGMLVLLSVLLASPVAALLGSLGALTAALTGLLLGLNSWEEVISGGFGFNAVLVAIALGGIFFAPTRRSLPIALAGAALTIPLERILLAPLTRVGLPLSSLPFVFTTWLLLVMVRRRHPALVPVALHAILTPEEHRRRFRVARRLLADFRLRLQHAASPGAAAGPSLASLMAPDRLGRLRDLFRQLDLDSSGCLSLEELHRAVAGDGAQPSSSKVTALLDRVLQHMDLNGDGRLDEAEFVEMALRLQRLSQGHERLLTYLLPLDANADGHLDQAELRRLLHSVGARPLQPEEEVKLFGSQQRPLSWGDFVDRLLLG
ncbi:MULTISPECIES: urea transporter [Aphanothece]|uniref:urea transporter n=1 Tax=Aphanothece TaxID=1121 RepID=UPI003985105E